MKGKRMTRSERFIKCQQIQKMSERLMNRERQDGGGRER